MVDGDSRDDPYDLCLHFAGGLSRCMDMVTPEDAIRRTELDFRGGGAIDYLTADELAAAEKLPA